MNEGEKDLLTSCTVNWKQIFRESLVVSWLCYSISIPVVAEEALAVVRSLIISYLLGAIQFVRKCLKFCL